ncbi:type 1 glutamine amidotransferase domain-containing protein [Enterococcus faecium]|uniref:type 1 glutamine amidotransferase domain-containing protein n=1 Tax=Enterococcus faecium TaxID=1352 RepID=UPI000352FFE1|nr:type 1 glutamine amidotransferase domain-containing protein [Enterococcus faecium]EGP4752395.1 type 1 glutamine amidotransferase domain-containing protein [Enterococcus faecium]EGP5130072.1 type 1 glutamine amidotransferase domain-containing protein [Enterococcus faecium]EGP5495977.1 type 1 glutamine amidotransferase domain-containing protein [Enterococcus faecium]EME3511739.1 type 1 glutamine amidotransferase domain-containing protein [Enterococcus faecium]EME3544087.1 type 1 glutamine ami
MKKILIVETNVNQYKGTNKATGIWLGETVEFLAEIYKYQFEADFVSPLGGYVPIDPRSMRNLDSDVIDLYSNKAFIEKGLRNTLSPANVKSKDYTAIYFTGGHGVMWDFPENSALQKIASDIYESNGYVLSVCHGIAGLFNIRLANNDYLIANKKLTGFTKTEELLAMKSKVVPFDNEEMTVRRKGYFIKKLFFKSHVVKDGHLITGQNPYSTRELARTFIKEVI